MTAADQDIENLRPVWRALSDLFLDTELQDCNLSSIARTLVESPYSLTEIETILYREVYPVCFPNMLCVAGEWAEFNCHWLEESILARVKRWWALGNIVQMNRWMIRDDWNRVTDLYSQQPDVADGPAKASLVYHQYLAGAHEPPIVRGGVGKTSVVCGGLGNRRHGTGDRRENGEYASVCSVASC